MNPKEFLLRRDFWDSKPSVLDGQIDKNSTWSSQKIHKEIDNITPHEYEPMRAEFNRLKKYTNTFKPMLMSGSNFNQKIKEIQGLKNKIYFKSVDKLEIRDNMVDVSLKQDNSILMYFVDTPSHREIYVIAEGTILFNTYCTKMFFGVKAENIYFENVNTSETLNMSYMFDGCDKLQELDLSKFDTKKVTNMSYMFNNCRELKKLNLIKIDTTSVSDMSYMFEECRNLNTELIIKNPNINKYTSMLRITSIEPNAKFVLNYIDDKTKDKAREMLKTKSPNGNVSLYEKPTFLLSGLEFNRKLKTLPTLQDATSLIFDKVESLSKIPFRSVDVSLEQDGSIIAYTDSYSNVRISSEGEMFAHENCNNMLYELPFIRFINFMNFNTKNVKTMRGMFRRYDRSPSTSQERAPEIPVTNLEEIIGLDIWNTRNVTDMSYMFWECSSLKRVKGMETWELDNLQNMSYMFYYCTSLKGTIKLSNRQANIANLQYEDMLCACASDDIDCAFLVDYTTDTQQIATNMVNTKYSSNSKVYLLKNNPILSGMFVASVIENTITKVSFGLGLHPTRNNARDISDAGDNSVLAYTIPSDPETLYIRSNNRISATDCSELFVATRINSVEFENFDTSKTTSIARMFEDCTYLGEVNLSTLDLSSVTQLYGLFRGCKYLRGEMTIMNPNVDDFTLVFGDDETNTTAGTEGGGTFSIHYIDEKTKETAIKMRAAAPSTSNVQLGTLKKITK